MLAHCKLRISFYHTLFKYITFELFYVLVV